MVSRAKALHKRSRAKNGYLALAGLREELCHQGSSFLSHAIREQSSTRFLRLPEVREMTGLSTSTIYRWMSEGTFPKQIQLGSRSVVWLESDVTKWMDQRIGAR